MPIGWAVVTGCTGPNACNFNLPNWTPGADGEEVIAQSNDGSCLYLDNCNNCVPIGNQDCIEDCAGVFEGDSYNNNCGDCVTSGTDNCVQGCADEWVQSGEETIIDDCGNCTSRDEYLNIGGVYIPYSCAPALGYTQGCYYCCDGTTMTCDSPGYVEGICVQSGIVNDVCGVCEGDGNSCVGSILFDRWVFNLLGVAVSESPDSNNVQPDHVYFNCIDCPTLGVETMINNGIEILLDVGVFGGAFDDEGDNFSDFDIDIAVGTYINRIVTLHDTGASSSCDDIYGHISTPEYGYLRYSVSQAEAHGGGIDRITLKPGFGQPNLNIAPFLFQDVEIGGQTIELTNLTAFDATYYFKIIIEGFFPIGDWQGDDSSITTNEIEGTFTIHHNMIYDQCGGYDAGDVNHTGAINCIDYAIALGWLEDGTCDDYHTDDPGSGVPDGCCNFTTLRLPKDTAPDDVDLDYLLNEILSGLDCGLDP